MSKVGTGRDGVLAPAQAPPGRDECWHLCHEAKRDPACRGKIEMLGSGIVSGKRRDRGPERVHGVSRRRQYTQQRQRTLAERTLRRQIGPEACQCGRRRQLAMPQKQNNFVKAGPVDQIVDLVPGVV